MKASLTPRKLCKMIMSWISHFRVGQVKNSLSGEDVAIDGLSVMSERRLESAGNLPNDVREVIFTSIFLNVLTLHGHHYKHIKPLWTLSEAFLMGIAHI